MIHRSFFLNLFFFLDNVESQAKVLLVVQGCLAFTQTIRVEILGRNIEL